jgi:hypothetical protein
LKSVAQSAPESISQATSEVDKPATKGKTNFNPWLKND